MKKKIALPVCSFLLASLLTGCMGDLQTGGKTINDMLMPTAAAFAQGDTGADTAVQAMAGTDRAAEANEAGTEAAGSAEAREENVLMKDALEAYPTLDNCRIDISIELDQNFSQGANTIVVPFKLQGTIQSVLTPLVKIGIGVASSSSFASEDMRFSAELYMEQTPNEWITYSNNAGTWVSKVQSAAKVPAVKIEKSDWGEFVSALKYAETAGTEDVEGVRTAKMEASAEAKLVHKLFGAQLCFVIPGMMEAGEKDKASDKNMPVRIWISGENEIIRMQFDAGAVWGKMVADSFSARSTDEFDISVKNVGIAITVTQLNTLDGFEIPDEVKTPAVTSTPAASPKTSPAT